MKLTSWLCGLAGHDYMRRWERTRLSLKCANCGHESPGWVIRPEGDRPELVCKQQVAEAQS